MPVNLKADVPESYIYIYCIGRGGVWVENITTRKYATELNYLQQTELTSYVIHVIHPT